jgi:hemolysin activation/secretion protein
MIKHHFFLRQTLTMATLVLNVLGVSYVQAEGLKSDATASPAEVPLPTNTKAAKQVETQPAVTEKNAATAEVAPVANPKQEPIGFNVFEFKIDGNSVLSNTQIEQAVYPFLGESKTIDDVEKARAALEAAYQNAGYLTVSVTIPQQEVDEGVVKLLVTEGAVERLRVKDAKYHSLAEIKSRVSEFEEGKVPHFPTAQQQLGTVNRGQNRQVTPVLRPGKSPGKVEVDLQVQDKLPLHGSLELNDRYSPNTTETRLNGSVRYENLWQKDHSLGVSFQVSPEDFNEVKVLSGTYVIPRMNGDYFAAYGVISDSNIAAVGDVNVVGNGYIVGARYIHPMPALENFYHSLTLGADYKVFKEALFLQGADSSIDSPVSYMMFSLGYDGTYQGKTSQTQGTLTLNFAPRGLGNTEKEFDERRNNARPNFANIRADLKHLQRLPYEWSMQARLLTQLSNAPLIAPEQMAIGGVDSVRGYLESSELGDNGLQATLELRTPPLKKFISTSKVAEHIKELYAFAFTDVGYIKIKDAVGQDPSRQIASAGVGLKLKANNGLFTYLDYAHAFRDSIEVDKGDDRLHFRLGYEW